MRHEQKSMSQALLLVFQEGLGDLDKSRAELEFPVYQVRLDWLPLYCFD